MVEQWQRIWPQLIYGAALCGQLAMLGMLWQRLRAVRTECERERQGREEMEAYTRLDLRIGRGGEIADLGRRISGVIAARSPFRRVAMLARDGEGYLYLAASEGMDAPTVVGVERWLRGLAKQERATGGRWSGGVRVGSGSHVIHLDKEAGRAIVVPVSIGGERLEAALLVCADSALQVPRRRVDEAVVSLEALAVRLGHAMAETTTELRPASVGKLAVKLVHSRSNLAEA
jgi:hypothetical protein